MNIWLIILLALLVLAYYLVRLTRPAPTHLSRFEVARRAKEGDERAEILRDRERVAPYVRALRNFMSLILLFAVDGVLSGLTGGVAAAILSIVLALVVAWLGLWSRLAKAGEQLYARIEPRLNGLYARRKVLFFLPKEMSLPTPRIDSEAELLHLLNTASFLETERRTLIHSALEFTGLSVRDAMSGRRSIKAIDKGDVVGPLLLDELYKTGKQAFVVTDGNLDTVVGILKLERLTSLDMQDSPPALKAMSPEVHFIDEDAPITDALSFLRSSKAPFLVVQDAGGATVGLLTMDNILRCLFES